MILIAKHGMINEYNMCVVFNSQGCLAPSKGK